MQYPQALFLDRDGIINHDPGDYTKSVGEFHILPQAIALLQWATSLGIPVIVITNQAGIDKGLYAESDLDAMHQALFAAGQSASFHIDAILFCPHHPEYSGRCFCRKPGHLLFQKALSKYGLTASKCLMIGDKERDIEAAKAAGIPGLLIPANTWDFETVKNTLGW